MMTTKRHLGLLPLDMDMPTRWKSNATSNVVTGRTKANQRHRFNRPRRPWQANATSHSASEGFVIRWREHVRTSTIYQAHDPLPPGHDPLIPRSCDIRFLGSTHERRKMTEKATYMPYLTDRVRLSPASVVDACTRTVQESRLFRRTYTQASTRLLRLNCASPIRIRRTNQALAPIFWSPFIRDDIGHCPSCRTREAHTRCPFYERERQNRCGHPPDSNDEPSLAPRYRCRSGR